VTYTSSYQESEVKWGDVAENMVYGVKLYFTLFVHILLYIYFIYKKILIFILIEYTVF
jgi:hypothetical protein